MAVVALVSAVLHLALFIGGGLVSLTLRRRDPRAALLTALGFGCVLLGNLVAFTQGFVVSRIVRAASSAAQVQTTFLIMGAVITIIELLGLGLIFFGLLRVVRHRGPVTPGMGAGW